LGQQPPSWIGPELWLACLAAAYQRRHGSPAYAGPGGPPGYGGGYNGYTGYGGYGGPAPTPAGAPMPAAAPMPAGVQWPPAEPAQPGGGFVPPG
jgi:hypothetical protein